MYYNTDGATVTKHIFNPITGELLATIEGDGSATSTQYAHLDHLGGTNVVTNENGDVVEAVDYYPFGEERINTGSFDEQRKFTGHEFDTDTDLTYAKQRYYDQDIGKFMSQDLAFLSVGTSKLVDILKMEKGNGGEDNNKDENERRLKALQQYLSDPQQMNSYSYANNNPVNLKDPNGEIPLLPILAVYSAIQTVIDAYDAKTTFIDYPDIFDSQEKYKTGFKLGLDVVFSGAGKITKDIGERAVIEIGPAVLDVIDHFFAPDIYKNINDNKVQPLDSGKDLSSSASKNDLKN